jgi:uncharacterized membrane protein YeaQ/YmgE (transglycosylase-associated protein family)
VVGLLIVGARAKLIMPRDLGGMSVIILTDKAGAIMGDFISRPYQSSFPSIACVVGHQS